MSERVTMYKSTDGTTHQTRHGAAVGDAEHAITMWAKAMLEGEADREDEPGPVEERVAAMMCVDAVALESLLSALLTARKRAAKAAEKAGA